MKDPIKLIALDKALKKKDADEARREVKPGTYPVDFTVHVSGSIKVGEDSDKVPTVSIPFKDVLALFVQRAGITRETSLKLLRECVATALKDDNTAAGCLDEHIEAVYAEEVATVLASLPRTKVAGQVRATLTVEEL